MLTKLEGEFQVKISQNILSKIVQLAPRDIPDIKRPSRDVRVLEKAITIAFSDADNTKRFREERAKQIATEEVNEKREKIYGKFGIIDIFSGGKSLKYMKRKQPKSLSVIEIKEEHIEEAIQFAKKSLQADAVMETEK